MELFCSSSSQKQKRLCVPSQQQDTLNDEEESEKAKKNHQWSEIPLEILNLVHDQLDWRDRIRVLSVCKHWKSLHRSVLTYPLALTCGFSILNCVVTSDNFSSIVKCNHTNICKTDTNSLRTKFGSDFFRTKVIAAKKGWLLMSDPIKPNRLFCYNPFVAAVMKLPLLNGVPILEPDCHPRAAFSGPPSASGSVILVVRCSGRSVLISLYFRGRTAWRWEHCSFEISDYYSCRCTDVVYSQGKLYCVFDCGRAGFFSLENRSWRTVGSIPSFSMLRTRCNLAESGGEIFVVCHGNRNMLYDVFRLDGKELDWIEVEGLGNRAIFLNFGLSSISMVVDAEFQNQLFSTPRGAAYFLRSFDLDSKCATQLARGWNNSNLLWIDPFC